MQTAAYGGEHAMAFKPTRCVLPALRFGPNYMRPLAAALRVTHYSLKQLILYDNHC
jgi:hypothetical protein